MRSHGQAGRGREQKGAEGPLLQGKAEAGGGCAQELIAGKRSLEPAAGEGGSSPAGPAAAVGGLRAGPLPGFPAPRKRGAFASAVHPFPAVSRLCPVSGLRALYDQELEGSCLQPCPGASPRVPQGRPRQRCCPQRSVRKPQRSRGAR